MLRCTAHPNFDYNLKKKEVFKQKTEKVVNGKNLCNFTHVNLYGVSLADRAKIKEDGHPKIMLSMQ